MRPGRRKVPDGRPGRVRAGPVGRLPRDRGEGRRRHRLPALLGAVRADGPARRAALGRRATCRARAATPTRPRSCSPRSSGSRSGWSSATWSASPPPRPTRWPWRTTSCTRRWPTWRPSSPGAAGRARSGSTGDGELIIPPLTAEDVPAEAEALRAELGGMLPRVPIASVLVEIDARTGFTDHLVHAGGKVTRPAELKRNLMYVIIAEATNMGLGAMAESCGVPYDVLAWTAEWYFRAETLEAANAAIVNYHHRLPMTRAFGTGTLSSSDGQRFPVKGKSLTARAPVPLLRPRAGHLHLHPRLRPALDVRHEGDRGDRAGKPLRAGRHPGQPDRPAHRRARHRHPRASLANFALFDLVGLQLSPRIRDLGKITLYRTGPRAELRGPLPVGRAAADPPAERGPDHRACGTTCCGSPRRSRAGTPPPPWWSASCARPSGSRTRWPPRSRSTGRCAAPSTPPGTWPTRRTGGGSAAS